LISSSRSWRVTIARSTFRQKSGRLAKPPKDERLHDGFPGITLPLLILHGTGDKITLQRGSEFFHETAGSTDKTLKLYEGHYHDLLADYGKEEVTADIKAWIDARIR
jgi:acylglycerol lipase